jgi:hypothetical protein
MSGVRAILSLALPLVACDPKEPPASEPAKTAETRTPDPTPVAATKTATAAEPAPAPAPAPAVTIAEPPMSVAKIREVREMQGKLVWSLAIDDSPALLKLRKTYFATDGVTKKVNPKAAGIPEGLREGDAWVMLAGAKPELAKVTGLGFPGGDDPVAWVVFRDEPSAGAIGMIWPGTALPERATMQSLPPTESAPHPEATSLDRVVLALREDGVTKGWMAGQAAKAEHAVSVKGSFVGGHRELVMLSLPMLSPTGEELGTHVASVWTLGDGDVASGGVRRHYASGSQEQLALRGLVDWNGDGTTDALVITETAVGDDFGVTTSLVWWNAEGHPHRRVIS